MCLLKKSNKNYNIYNIYTLNVVKFIGSPYFFPILDLFLRLDKIL